MSWSERAHRAVGVPVGTGHAVPAAPARRLALPVSGWAIVLALTSVLAATGAHLGRTGLPTFLGFLLAVVATGSGLTAGGRRAGAWAGIRWLGSGFLLAAAAVSILWAAGRGGVRTSDSVAFDTGMALVLAVGLGAVVIDVRQHASRDATEVFSDILLLAALIGGGVYLLLRSGMGAHGSFLEASLTAAIASSAVLLFSASAILTLWVPSGVHAAQMGCWTLLAISGMAVAWGRQFDVASGAPGLVQVAAGAALTGLAAIITVDSPRLRNLPQPKHAMRARPALLSLSLGGACIWLGAALLTMSPGTDRLGSVALVAGVAALVALRTLGNQRAAAAATAGLASALRQREEALTSLHDAAAQIARSEARLRQLLDAAADGIVELGPDDVVVRANDAFCDMIGVSGDDVVGKAWRAVAADARAESAFGALREGGQAVLTFETRTLHLEARVSSLPTDPPGTLLLVRDVTANKVAEQTIRTLFQFLQDRDEDRTRYLRRSSLAIEAERNRIARDLHDGPIQGVAAASLSLEAVKLMIDAGRHAEAAQTLGKVRRELSEETENLRHLMSDLRPPLLEERGLLAAVRELCMKFQDHTGINVSIRSACEGLVPSEIETIAYRVIQEALSNVAKHAGAANVIVRVACGHGALEAEVQDDGCGFDSSGLREFLRRGKVGLASMRERTELGSGTFMVRSRAGGGTTVTATLPIDVLGATRTDA